jgi:hypothetical protein
VFQHAFRKPTKKDPVFKYGLFRFLEFIITRDKSAKLDYSKWKYVDYIEQLSKADAAMWQTKWLLLWHEPIVGDSETPEADGYVFKRLDKFPYLKPFFEALHFILL